MMVRFHTRFYIHSISPRTHDEVGTQGSDVVGTQVDSNSTCQLGLIGPYLINLYVDINN